MRLPSDAQNLTSPNINWLDSRDRSASNRMAMKDEGPGVKSALGNAL